MALWGTLISGQLAGLGGIACLALSQGGNVMSLRVRQLEEMEKRLWNLHVPKFPSEYCPAMSRPRSILLAIKPG